MQTELAHHACSTGGTQAVAARLQLDQDNTILHAHIAAHILWQNHHHFGTQSPIPWLPSTHAQTLDAATATTDLDRADGEVHSCHMPTLLAACMGCGSAGEFSNQAAAHAGGRVRGAYTRGARAEGGKRKLAAAIQAAGASAGGPGTGNLRH